MDNNNKITMNRRQFNRGALAVGLIAAVSHPVIAHSSEPMFDGLIQLKDDGRVYLYSSGSRLGLYDDFSNVEKIADAAGCLIDELVVVNIDNPFQLPCILGQNKNQISNSDIETSHRAAKLLGEVRVKAVPQKSNPKMIIEEGVSDETKAIIKTLDQQGIILATRGRG